MNVEPLPSRLSTLIEPSIRSTTCFTIDKPETRAADFAGAGPVDAVEAFEDARQIVGWHAAPGVRNGDEDAAVRRDSGIDAGFAARLVELDGVIEKIDQRLFQPEGVPGDEGVAHRSAYQIDAANARFRFDGEQRGIDRVFDRDGAGLGIAPAGFEVGESQQIRCDIVQPDGVRLNDFDKAAIVIAYRRARRPAAFRHSREWP